MRKTANNLFSLFHQAAQEKDRRFSLLRNDKSLTCHWAACGGGLAILDLYPVSEGNLVRNKVGATICVDGPPTVILDFVENEYNNNLAISQRDRV